MTVDTFTATIYVGLRVGRTVEPSRWHSIEEVREVCQAYCDGIGLCVTVTPTTFIYTKGREPGAAVGLINYPRYPSTPEAITKHALALAGRLQDAMEQMAVSVVFRDRTVLLEAEPSAQPAGKGEK